MKNIKFSISTIVPVFNTEKYICMCLDSLINQSYSKLQLVLVDDGSSDLSGEIAEEYAMTDSRFICIHKNNEGVSKARNCGVMVADGDYVHYMDSDDYLDLDAYEYIVSHINESKYDIFGFEYYATYTDHECVNFEKDDCYGLLDKETAHRVVARMSPFATTKIYRRKILLQDSPVEFNESIARGEDTLYVQMAIESAEHIWFDKRPLYHYVQSNESACRGTFRKNQLTAIRLYEAYKPLFNRYPNLQGIIYVVLMNLHITLYCDMFEQKEKYICERNEIYSSYKERFWETIHYHMKTKQFIKFCTFYISPYIFCKFHEIKKGL